jgi:hypothetical protein
MASAVVEDSAIVLAVADSAIALVVADSAAVIALVVVDSTGSGDSEATSIGDKPW